MPRTGYTTEQAKQISADLRAVGRAGVAELKASIASVGAVDSGALAASITSKLRSQGGLPDRLSFPFLTHGIFAWKGVGRGVSAADRRSGKATTRVEKNWVDPAFEVIHKSVADALAQADADAAVKALGQTIETKPIR